MKKSTLQKQIQKANKIHNNKYDYSLIKEYKGVMYKYPIICPIHGEWEVTIDNHNNKKSGCPKCKGRNLTFKEKIEQANIIHNNEYDYSLVNKDLKQSHKVDIIHKKCKTIFNNTWDNHINKKQGCPNCAKYGRKSLTLDQIKNKILELNNKEYEYNWDSYKGYYKKINIKCPKHGWFKQQVSNHLFGQKCPKCSRSKGEEEIEKYLIYNDIDFQTQKTFNECISPKTKGKLKFDFYLPKYNLCIEYDGELHYQSVEWFGGKETLKKQKYYDLIKNKYCKDNNINLLRISYIDFNNINNILNLNINKELGNNG